MIVSKPDKPGCFLHYNYLWVLPLITGIFFNPKRTYVQKLLEDRRPAIAVRRQRIELAGAAIGAVAIGEFTPFEFPFDHRGLPFSDPDPAGESSTPWGCCVR